MKIKLVIFGDIFGQRGVDALSNNIKYFKHKYKPDLIFANAENTTMGKSMSHSDYTKLKGLGIDYFTMGNHFVHLNEFFEYYEKTDDISIPINYENLGMKSPYVIFTHEGVRILLMNVVGNTFVSGKWGNAIATTEKVLSETYGKYDVAICDFHAEATAEKLVYFYKFRDKIKLIYGTHTHIQTSDERIVNGSGYITDLGFVGVFDSSIGIKFSQALEKNIDPNQKVKFTPETEGDVRINGIYVEIKNNNVVYIERFCKDFDK